MSARKISQHNARWTAKRVEQLERERSLQRNRWNKDWVPGWVNIDAFVLSDAQFARLATARLLGHAVIMVPAGSGNEVRIYADKLP